jgi:hypothetical protein
MEAHFKAAVELSQDFNIYRKELYKGDVAKRGERRESTNGSTTFLRRGSALEKGKHNWNEAGGPCFQP